MSETYQVTLHHRGQTVTIPVGSEEKILEAALAQGIDLPCSCQAGVCTTCAARVLSGEVKQPEALGISPATQAQGFALLCVAYANSNLEIESDQEEVVYKLQFGAG